jgi:hypothetical protein
MGDHRPHLTIGSGCVPNARLVAVVDGVVIPAHTEERVVTRTPGRLVVPLPHDCVAVLGEATSLSGHTLARAAAVLDQQPSVGTVFITTDENMRDGVQPGHRWLRLAAANGPDIVGGRCAVLRRAIFEAAGQHGLGTRSGELSLWLRAAALADVAHVVEPRRCVSPTSLRPAVAVGEVTELHERAHAFRELLDGFAPLHGRSRLRSTAYRALARSARGRARVAAYEGDRVEASLCLHLARDVTRWRRRG